VAAKDVLGEMGEQLAAELLQEQGLEVLARNWRCREGELDIVARDSQADAIVFVEVKTRSSDRFGHPAEAITHTKLHRLRVLAARWLAEHDVRAAAVRIDVVAIVRRAGQAPSIEHLRAVG